MVAMAQPRGMLDEELAQIETEILRLGSMVEEAIQQSIVALKGRDLELARHIIVADQEINGLRYKIENLCLTVIATQQPVAGDLRMIIAAMHVAVEMERMADHAEGIAQLVTRMADEPLLKPLIDVPRMANIACEMLRASLDAFLTRDTKAAQAVVARDDEIDQLHDQVFRELLTYMLQDPSNINRATYLLWVAHNLERIGDRITNISERVVFMATGELKELDGSWRETGLTGKA
jgi:phosphate transport system protein